MLFRQVYDVREDGLGSQRVQFVVSDDYEGMFGVGGDAVDVFMLGSVKQDLNTEDNKFAIDELNFTINQAACTTDNDLKALFFVLDATDFKVSRFCAVFFGDVPSVETMLFIGKINPNVSGTDLLWDCDEYNVNIDPVREYNFTALSFDISVIEDAVINEPLFKIVNNQSVRINNVSERWLENDLYAFKEVFRHRLFYGNVNNFLQLQKYQYLTPMGNLFNVLNKYLQFTEQIILEKNNIQLAITLLPSDLGFALQPTEYILTQENTFAEPIGVNVWGTRKVMGAKNVTLSDDDRVSLHINYLMLDPSIASNDNEANVQYSFRSFTHVADLLFGIARSLNCFIRVTYTSTNSINIEFVSRVALVKDEYTYMLGSEEAGFDTSSIMVSQKNRFYASANSYAKSSYDTFIIGQTKLPSPSSEFERAHRERDAMSKRANIDFERIILSLSVTMIIPQFAPLSHRHHNLPLNVRPYMNLIEGWHPPEQQVATFVPPEFLHSALYVELPNAPEPDVNTFLNHMPVVRPASGLLANIGGVNTYFDTLEEYINTVLARDTQYYETEYTVTVPFWNGFSKDTDGSSPQWQNIQLGSKIKLSEEVQRFLNEQWQTVRVTRSYVVVGIERNLQKPETKLKLHSLERFAFGSWDGDTSQLKQGEITAVIPTEPIGDHIKINVAGSLIRKGDAVMVNPDFTISPSKSHSDYYGKTFGIALEDGLAGDHIKVQIAGLVISDTYQFNGVGQVYARTNPNGSNITETVLQSITPLENMVILLGTKQSARGFYLNINELIYTGDFVDA